MPDHVHWLFELKRSSLSQSVKRVKSIFTSRGIERVWDYGFYDHAIRSDESLINVARYIVANPLRTGLVDKVGDYSHWDSIWLE
jgi:putative transposase